MQCWHCGATVRSTAKICIYCGEALADDAFDRDVEFAREQEYESARQPTPMRWTSEEPERKPTPMYRPGAEPEREPAPMYRPGGDPAVPDRNANAAMPPRDAAPARDATPQRRGLLSPSRGFVPSDDGHAPRKPRRGTPGPRRRGDTPPPPAEPHAPRPPRSRAPAYDEHGHEQDRYAGGDDEEYRRSRGADERRGYPPEDERRGHRGDRGPGPERDRGHEREAERERDNGSYGGDGGGRSRHGYDEYAGYAAPRRDARADDNAYPDEGRDGRGGRYDPRGGWDEPTPRGPLEDSWGLPALTGPEASVRGWTDEWQAPGGGPPTPQWAPPPRERDYGSPQPARPGRQGRRPAPGKPARRKKGRRGLIVVLLLAIGLSIIAGGILLGGRVLHKLGLGSSTSAGAPTFATYTPGPTPTVAAGFKQFASAPSAYVLNYPQDWSQSSQNDTSQGQPDYLDTFAQGGASVTIERAPAFDAAADTAIIQGEVRGGQQAGLTFTETTSAAGLAAIGGEQWTRREYDVNGQSGKEHMAIFACHHNGHGFAIVLRAPAGSYAQLYSTSFKTVLSSFRFAS